MEIDISADISAKMSPNDSANIASELAPEIAPEIESEAAAEDEFTRFLESTKSVMHSNGEGQSKSLRAWVDLAETYRIIQALRECGGNRSAAARILGIGRRTLYAKMDKLGISASWRMD